MEEEKIKKYIDEAEKELKELFNDLIYEHCDNEGQYQLNNLASGFNTLLKYARKWQELQESGIAENETGYEIYEKPNLTEKEKEK